MNSGQLEKGAAEIRRRKKGPRLLPAAEREVSAAQLDAAAAILRNGEKSVITSPPGLASEHELPGFIDKGRQDPNDPNVLVFEVGIIPARLYRIDRQGNWPEPSYN